MVRKKRTIIRLPKRKREQDSNDKFIDIDVNQNSKKSKIDDLHTDITIKMFDEKFKDTIRTAIEVFHNRTTTTSIKEKLAYFQILKKVTLTLEWKLNRIISNKQQMECLIQKRIETPKECKELRGGMEKFIEYRMACFPGRNRHIRARSLAKHYQSELHCHKITQDLLKSKIDDLIRALESSEDITSPVQVNKSRDMIKKYNKYQKLCRLCGSKHNLIYSLTHKKDGLTIKEAVEHYCRVEIKESSDLPGLICKTCKDSVDFINNFSKKIEEFQCRLNSDLESYIMPTPIPLEMIKIENDQSVTTNDDTHESIIEFEEFEIIENNYASLDHSNDNIDEVEQRTEADIESNNNSDKQPDCFEMIQKLDCSFNDPKNDELSSTSSRISADHLPHCQVVLEKLPIYFLPNDEENITQEMLREFEKKIYNRKRTWHRGRSKSVCSNSFLRQKGKDLLEIDFSIPEL